MKLPVHEHEVLAKGASEIMNEYGYDAIKAISIAEVELEKENIEMGE